MAPNALNVVDFWFFLACSSHLLHCKVGTKCYWIKILQQLWPFTQVRLITQPPVTWPTRPVVLPCSWTTLTQEGSSHHEQGGPGGLSSGKLAPSGAEERQCRNTSLICEARCPKIKGGQVLKRIPNGLAFVLLLQTSNCTWHSQSTPEKPSHYKALSNLSWN